jgi:NitT/TauT family transport system substrate-binding protein
MNSYKVASAILAFVLSGCDRTPSPATKPATVDTVSVRQEWFPNANYAGPVLASAKFASEHNLVLNIASGSETIDPVTQVVARQDQFGEAGADRVLAAVDKGAPLTIIAVIHPVSPTVFLSKSSAQIFVPTDFRGRKIGVLTGTATEYVYRALLKKAGLTSRDVKEVEAGFDLQGFLAGVYDVRPAFAYDEPVSLEMQHVQFETMKPAKFGVRFVGTVYFARTDYVQSHPQIIQSFVSSLIDGWRLAIEDPKNAIAVLKSRYRELDDRRELISLQLANTYVKPAGDSLPPFLASPSDWQATLEALRALGIATHVNLSGVVDERFVRRYFSEPSIQ